MFKTPPIRSKYINTLPILLSCALAVGLIYGYGRPDFFAALMLGIIAGGLVDLDNGLNGKLKNLLYTLTAFAVSSLSVQFSFDHPVLLTAVFTLLAFVFTFIGAAGVRYRTISFGTLAVAVYTALTHHADAPIHLNTLLILAGTLMYSALALVVHILFPHRAVQEHMAAAYDALAHYLRVKAEFFDPDETESYDRQQFQFAMANSGVINAFNQCRSSLFYRMRGQHRHPRTARMLRYYFTAQDIHERISSSHVNYQDFTAQMRHTDLIYRVRNLLQLQAEACRDFAAALRANRDFSGSPRLERATAGAQEALQHYAGHPPEHSSIAPYRVQRLLDNISHVSSLFANLSAADFADLAEANDKTRIQAPENSSFKHARRSLKKQSTRQSPVFRHAVRMALTVLSCCLIINFVGQIQWRDYQVHLGFWILLTAIFVCQPNYSATQKRLIQRIIGTLAGVLAGFALPYLDLTLAHKLVLGALATTLFFYFRISKHSYATFFITLQTLIGFSIAGQDLGGYFLPRVVDTLIGASLAGAAVYLLWPDWKYLSLEKTAAAAVQSNAGYLNAVLDEYVHGHSDNLTYRVARRASHDQAAALSSTVSDMSGEAEKYGARLNDAFYLLKANYSLLGYIAALGAYRDKINHENQAFLSHFQQTGHQLADLLEQIADEDEERFSGSLNEIHRRLAELRELAEQGQPRQNHMLRQQLAMLADLIGPCRQALLRSRAEAVEALPAQSL